MIGFPRHKSFLLGAAYYLVVSLAIILFASPLFRVLGYESSAAVSLFASIHILYYTSAEARKHSEKNTWSIIKNIWVGIFLLSNIPLVISIISSLFITNCSLKDGVVFYIEVTYPTILIAVFCSIRFFSATPTSRIKRNISIALFWIFTLFLSLLPGYFSAKIYSYGWQYGYFPGFVWDEAMELHTGYWISRISELSIILTWIIFSNRILREGIKSPRGDMRKKVAEWKFWLLAVASTIFAMIFLYQFSDISLKNFLPKEVAVGNVTIHCRHNGFTDDELLLTTYNIKKYVEAIDNLYVITSSRNIDIYIFPNSDDLYEYVGTREASITKPWKHAIYIAKPNLRSLKHELVHAVLADYGSFPFGISWSTGLTEGVAVAMEQDYDGIRDCDEMSARIIQMKLAHGVADIMQPSGFLSSASAQSYELSGSFSHYLLYRFGAEKYLRLYKETDFKEIYAQSLPSLESDWRNWLKKYQMPMDHYDSLRTLFYFKRTSILQEPCVRRVGKLMRHADEAFREKDYKRADSLYAIVVSESGRLSAIRGRVISQLHLNDPHAALSLLDTITSAKETNNLSALRILRGDVIVLSSGDLVKASAEWTEALKVELGDTYFFGAFMRLYFFGESDPSRVQKILRDLYGLEEVKDRYLFLFGKDSLVHSPAFDKARLYLYTSYLEKQGKLKEAYTAWTHAPVKTSNNRPGEELFDILLRKKYSNYIEVFRE